MPATKKPEKASKTIVVTGGAGFIGTHLIRRLLESSSNRKIIVLDIAEPRIQTNSIKFQQVDISSRSQMEELDLEQVDEIVHLAALSKEPGYRAAEYFRVNYLGTRLLIDFAERHDCKNIVFTSTMMVFGATEQVFAECDLCVPDTPYGTSKLLAEEILRSWACKGSDRRLRIIRPGVVFGAGENGNYTRLYHALKKNRFVYIGRRTTIKGSIYVKDLVELLLITLSDCSHFVTYHAVYPEPYSISEICDSICEVFGFHKPRLIVPYSIAFLMSMPFALLDPHGIKFNIHPRRVQKLYNSNNLSASRLKALNFFIHYPLKSALIDWKNDCGGRHIH